MKWFADKWTEKFRMMNDRWPKKSKARPPSVIRHSSFVILFFLLALTASATNRAVRVEGMTLVPSATNSVRVLLESLGNEKALGFNLGFDPAVLRYVRSQVGVDASAAGAALTTNPNEADNLGRLALTLTLDLFDTNTFPVGTNHIVDVFFTTAPGVTGGVSAVVFTNAPGVTEISDANANELTATYFGSSVSVVLQCGFALGTNVMDFSDTGGLGSVSLLASNAVCAWSLVNTNPWVEITSATNGTGSTTVGFLVSANPETAPRSGSILIADQSFIITQQGFVCSYSVAPTGRAHGATTETNSFDVLAGNSCAWSVLNTNPWISILAGSGGSGNGPATYAVADNFSATPRTGTVSVAGQTFAVSQAAFTCSYSLLPTGGSHSFAAVTNSFTLSASNFCAWAVVNTNPWVTILSASSGSGDATISYALTQNSVLTERSGALLVADQIFTITQQGQPCSYAFTPTNVFLGALHSTGVVSVTAGASCAWTVNTTNDWLQIISATDGVGDGTFTLAAPQNWGAARTGLVFVADQMLSVMQAGYAGGFAFSSINTAPGEISLTLTGGPSGVWSLEISGDLTNWSAFASLTNTTGRVDLLTPAPETNRFYRATRP